MGRFVILERWKMKDERDHDGLAWKGYSSRVAAAIAASSTQNVYW